MRRAPGYDPCVKFQPLAEHADIVFTHHYTHLRPSTEESQLVTEHHTRLLQYLFNKRNHRWRDQTVDAV